MRVPELLFGVLLGFLLNAYFLIGFNDIGEWIKNLDDGRTAPNQTEQVN